MFLVRTQYCVSSFLKLRWITRKKEKFGLQITDSQTFGKEALAPLWLSGPANTDRDKMALGPLLSPSSNEFTISGLLSDRWQSNSDNSSKIIMMKKAKILIGVSCQHDTNISNSGC